MEKRNYSLSFLKNLQKIHLDVNQIVEENRSVVAFFKNEELEIIIKDLAPKSNFNFKISNPRQVNSKINYKLEYTPRNTTSVEPGTITVESERVMNTLKGWIHRINEYNKITITKKDKIVSEYADEFYEDFEIIDEDAEENPFELEKQLILHNFLIKAITVLEEDGDNQHLIEEAQDLKANLPKLTKKATIRKLSNLFAKIRHKSLPLIKEVLDVAQKELYKRITNGGFKMIGDFVDGMI